MSRARIEVRVCPPNEEEPRGLFVIALDDTSSTIEIYMDHDELALLEQNLALAKETLAGWGAS